MQEPRWYPSLYKQSESESHSVVSDSLRPHGLYSPWNSPGQNTGLGRLSLLQGIFPTEGLSPGLPHCRQIPYQLSHKGRPRILEWVAYPFSSGFSQPRNQTRVSCIAGRFFTNWEQCYCNMHFWKGHRKYAYELDMIWYDYKGLLLIFLEILTSWWCREISLVLRDVWWSFHDVSCMMPTTYFQIALPLSPQIYILL